MTEKHARMRVAVVPVEERQVYIVDVECKPAFLVDARYVDRVASLNVQN